jgi:tetratricopeptide (TPR) repeat protein
MTLRHKAFAVALLASPLFLSACGGLRARAAFQDANKLYKEEKYKEAIVLYQKAVDLDPTMAEGWFYLANSNQALYRPGKASPENSARLEAALQGYLKALEVNPADGERLRRVRANTLVALVQIYSEEPHKNYSEAVKYADDLVKDAPDDIKNLFALAALYEKFDKYDEAEKAYLKAFKGALDAYLGKLGVTEDKFNQDPASVQGCDTLAGPELAACKNLKDNAVKACSGLAGFYNKPYWDGRARFDDAIATLERCAALAPNDCVGYYKISTFFWDKAFRDPLISEAQKLTYADKGLVAANKALSLCPEYCDALVYKGLLLRVKAQVATNPRTRALLLDEADAVRKLAVECKKQAAESANAAATPTP